LYVTEGGGEVKPPGEKYKFGYDKTTTGRLGDLHPLPPRQMMLLKGILNPA
jgi:hypothetical protein